MCASSGTKNRFPNGGICFRRMISALLFDGFHEPDFTHAAPVDTFREEIQNRRRAAAVRVLRGKYHPATRLRQRAGKRLPAATVKTANAATPFAQRKEKVESLAVRIHPKHPNMRMITAKRLPHGLPVRKESIYNSRIISAIHTRTLPAGNIQKASTRDQNKKSNITLNHNRQIFRARTQKNISQKTIFSKHRKFFPKTT